MVLLDKDCELNKLIAAIGNFADGVERVWIAGVDPAVVVNRVAAIANTEVVDNNFILVNRVIEWFCQ